MKAQDLLSANTEILKQRGEERLFLLRQGGAGGAAGGGPTSLRDRASALLKLPAPSKLQARLIRSCQGTPLLHNNRLAGGAGGLPPELQHPAFGVFTDWMWGGRRPHDMEAGSPSVSSPEGPQPSPETQYQLDEQDMRTAAELCDAAFPYYGTEEELQQRVVPLLQKYFGDVAPWSLLSGLFAEGGRSELKPDWYAGHMQGPSGLGMRRYLAITGILLLLLEMKNGLKCDTDGDPGLQGFGYYSRFWASRLTSSATSKAAWEVLRRSCAPALLIEVLGPHLRVSALAWLGSVELCPLTPLLNLLWLGGGNPQVVQLARALRATKEALKELRASYSRIMSACASATPATVRTPGLDDAWPYPLREEYCKVERMDAGELMYTATPLGSAAEARVVVKFCRHYCVEAHCEWARLNLAPAVNKVKDLPGGFIMVEMELLDPEHWVPLYDLGGRDERMARAAACAALERAYKEGKKRFVHGDARAANCLVRPTGAAAAAAAAVAGSGGSGGRGRSGGRGGSSGSGGSGSSGGWEVRFVDFEFAGEEGKGRYPVPLNPAVPWAEGAGFGQLLQHSHDTHLLGKREGPSRLSSRHGRGEQAGPAQPKASPSSDRPRKRARSV